MFNTMKNEESVALITAAQLEVDEVDGNFPTKQTARAIKSKIADVKLPVDQTLMSIGNSQSAKVKKLMGLDYQQIHDEAEPDLDQLSLTFISDELTSTFKLGSVAELLPMVTGYTQNQPLIIFMHGFTDDPTSLNFGAVNEAFQSIGHCNILALDASPLIRYLYLRSSTYVRFIGEKLGETLASMVKSGLDRKHIHLVGHSLGAHIAGFAGKAFYSHTGTLIARISGLDPAGPAFSHEDKNLRLAASDAEFVDVIHTNAGVYGMTSPVGHVDFFPNGGEQQPNSFFQFESHNRVVQLFAESVRNPEAFPARACKDWKEFVRGEGSSAQGDVAFMGYGCKPGTKGLYFLRTRDDPPYGFGIEVSRETVIKTAKQITRQVKDIFN